jgi:hypothetical protein
LLRISDSCDLKRHTRLSDIKRGQSLAFKVVSGREADLTDASTKTIPLEQEN